MDGMKTLTIRVDHETEEAISFITERLIDDEESIGHKRQIIISQWELHKKHCQGSEHHEQCEKNHQEQLKDLDSKEKFVEFITKIHAGLIAQD